MKIFAPLWCPPEHSMAGGFYRAQRMLENLTLKVFAVRNESFPLALEAKVYRARWLYSPLPSLFRFMRILNWAWSAFCMALFGLLGPEVDAVYVSTSEILPVTVAGFLVARLRRKPLILCNLNVRDTELWFINRQLHRRSDAIITLSDALACELREEGIKVPIFLGSVGVDDLSVHPKPPPNFEAIFVARHTVAKGIMDLLDIWAEVRRHSPDAQLVTVGACTPAMKKNIDRRLVELNLKDAVVMQNVVNERQKWELYSRARLCVFPSHVEGWGIVPIEAHLAGLPVVAYALKAYEATIADSPAATLITTGDTKGFAQAVLRVLKLSEGESDNRGAAHWAAQFSWRSAADQEKALIQRCAAHSRALR